jgi:signal transduction histidine kinase
MNKTEVTIICKDDNPLRSEIIKFLNDEFTIRHFSNCSSIPDQDATRALLSPSKILLILCDDFSEKALQEQIRPIEKCSVSERLFSILFVSEEPSHAKFINLIGEIDDLISTNQINILPFKIEHLVDRANLCKKLTRDLNEASDIALLSMSHSSELGEISRFILASYNCKTYEELIDSLIGTVTIFNISCSALVVVDDKVVVRTDDQANANAKKSMLKFHGIGRIHKLGSEVIVTYTNSSIMIHNMPLDDDARYGRLLDNFALLGNCFEARVKGIHAEEEADAASRSKTMFLATMSHELRTPMNSVIGFTERLIDKLDGRITEKEAKHLNAIKRNGDHLLLLINDILDISKIEVGKMEIHPERVNVSEQVENIFVQLQPIATNHNLEFCLDSPESNIEILADPKRFTQMVMNLASNAIKYTPKGKVDLAIRQHTDEDIGPCVQISVSDTGIGISEEDQQKLFGNFVQIDSALSRKVEGTGLGLAISVVFANMHGGRIDVKSEIDIGSQFSLLLPYDAGAYTPVTNLSNRIQ